MRGSLRLLITMIAGAFVMHALPRAGVLSATSELIGLLSLLMAGLLPTMLLTATVLRAGALSAKGVGEYGAALKVQMHFWSVLFVACLVATLATVLAKVFGTPGVQISIPVGKFVVTQDHFISLALCLAGAGIGVVLQRLPAAYSGILSLLAFNVKLAQEEAAGNDAIKAQALVRETVAAASKMRAV